MSYLLRRTKMSLTSKQPASQQDQEQQQQHFHSDFSGVVTEGVPQLLTASSSGSGSSGCNIMAPSPPVQPFQSTLSKIPSKTTRKERVLRAASLSWSSSNQQNHHLQTLQFSNKPRLRRRHSSSIVEEVIDDSSSQVTALFSNVKTAARGRQMMLLDNSCLSQEKENNDDADADKEKPVMLPVADAVLEPPPARKRHPPSEASTGASSSSRSNPFWPRQLRRATPLTTITKTTMTSMTHDTGIVTAALPFTSSSTANKKQPRRQDDDDDNDAIRPPELLKQRGRLKELDKEEMPQPRLPLTEDSANLRRGKSRGSTNSNNNNSKNNNNGSRNGGGKRIVAISSLTKPERCCRRSDAPPHQQEQQTNNTVLHLPPVTPNTPMPKTVPHNEGEPEKEFQPQVLVSTLLNPPGKSKQASPRRKSFPPRSLVDEQVICDNDEGDENVDDNDDDLGWGSVPRAFSTSASESEEDQLQVLATTTTTSSSKTTQIEHPWQRQSMTRTQRHLELTKQRSQELETQKRLEQAIGSWNRNIMSYVQDLPLAALLNAASLAEASSEAEASSASSSSSESVSEASASSPSDDNSTDSSLAPIGVVLVPSPMQAPTPAPAVADQITTLAIAAAARRPSPTRKSTLSDSAFQKLTKSQKQQQQQQQQRHKNNNNNRRRGPGELRFAKFWKSQPSIPREVEIRTKPSLESATSTSNTATSSFADDIQQQQQQYLMSYTNDYNDHSNNNNYYYEHGLLAGFQEYQDVVPTLTQDFVVPTLTEDNVASLSTYFAKDRKHTLDHRKVAASAAVAAGVETSCSNLTKTTAASSTSSSTTTFNHCNNGIKDKNSHKSWLQQWRRSTKYAWENKDWLRVVNLPKSIVVSQDVVHDSMLATTAILEIGPAAGVPC